MKSLRKLLCLLLAGCLLFAAACGNGKNKDNNADFGVGRYVETDITPPIDGRFTCYLSADGTIVCFDSGLNTRYESADGGGSWSELPGPGRNSDRYQFLQGGALLPDDSLLVFIQGEGLQIVSQDGNSRHFPVEEIDNAHANDENVNITLLQVLENRLLISYMIGGFMQQTRGGGPMGGGNTTSGGGPQGGGPGSGPGPVTQTGPQGGSPQGSGPQGGGPQGGGPQGGSQETFQGRVIGEAPDGDSDGDSDETPDTTYTEAARPSGGTSSGTVPVPINSKNLLCDLATGQIIADISVENASSAVTRDGSLYILNALGNVSEFNLSDGAASGKPEIKFTGAAEIAGPRGMSMMRLGDSGGSTLAASADGGLYAAVDGSLLLANAEGIISTVLESTAYSIGTPRSTVSTVFTLDDGSIVVNMLSNGMTNRLYKYSWNENATVNPEKTLTVWSLHDNNFVRAAISELRKKHPDSLITYEVALGGNSAVDASDAIKTLNTRLLGNDGPDVILLDGCSADSYADRGMLLEMSGLINTGDVFGSLLDSYLNDGELYYMPTQFLMPMLMGSPESLSDVRSLDDLVSLVVNGNDLPAGGAGPGPRSFSGVDESERSALYFSNLKELCDTLWISCAPDIVKDNKLNTDALRRYLQAVKAISDKYDLPELSANRDRMGVSIAFSDGGGATALPGSLMWYTMQLTHYAAFSAGNLQLLQMMMDRSGSALDLFPGITPGAWQPSTVVGISADAKNQQFAAGLVEAMLSVEIQQLNYGTGLPVTGAGLQAQVDAINERRAENGEEPFSFDPNILVSRLSSPSMGDTVLTEMMWNSLEKCCKGEIDVDGAVREIEQNVKNYLAERS